MRKMVSLGLVFMLLASTAACKKETAEDPGTGAVPENTVTTASPAPSEGKNEETSAPAATSEITKEDIEAFLRGENKALLEEFNVQE